MDLGTNLIFLVLFGIIGFVISKAWGINPYRIFSDLVAVVILIPFMFFALQAGFDPKNAINLIEPMITFFANSLPGIVIGDAAGTMVAAITGERQ